VAFRRDFIIGLASRLKLPAVYPFRYYAVDGGLISYGPDTRDPGASAPNVAAPAQVGSWHFSDLGRCAT
jgi:hypothetical protein